MSRFIDARVDPTDFGAHDVLVDIDGDRAVALTKRELFAAMAMHGLAAKLGVLARHTLVELAVKMADDLITALEADQ